MVLLWPAERQQMDERLGRRRKRIAKYLIALFSRSFPEICYDLFWQSPTINAQAWRLGDVQHVTVYGGLVRHAAMSRSGLALSIAHETGHHLGGLPRDPTMRWMTWQGQADYWAARTAMPFVFGSRAYDMTLRGARQILKLYDEFVPLLQDDEPDMTAQCRYRIFCAGASGSEMPACAKAEYQRCFGVPYPNP
jgi:hypothetical protein